MKPRIDTVAAAAMKFATSHPRRPTVASALASVLPETAKDMEKVAPFEQKTTVPRGLLKVFISSLIERVLTKKATVEHALTLLTATERDYFLNVLDEVYIWAEAQGFDLGEKSVGAVS